jgi:hypothetical protein
METMYLGDYGVPVDAYFKDSSGNAIDITSVTDKAMIFRSPTGVETPVGVSFIGSGSDGGITYTIPQSFIDQAGLWAYRGKYQTPSSVLYSDWVEFLVLTLDGGL